MSGKAVRETLGFLAVVAGLVFVGMEIRQNSLSVQAATYQDLIVQITNLNLMEIENPEFGEFARMGTWRSPSTSSGWSPTRGSDQR